MKDKTKHIGAMVLTIVFLFAAVPAARAQGAVKETESPVLEKAASYNYHKIKLTWQPVPGADGYQIYRASAEKGRYKRIATITDTDKTSYINGSRITGKRYYYKVRAYRQQGSRKIYTKFSQVKSAYARPVKVKNLTADWQQAGYKLSWSPVKGADGYQVAARQEGDSAWRKGWYYRPGDTYEETFFVGDIDVNGTEAFVPAGNCNYDFKVRAWRLSEGKKVYGRYSEIFSPEPAITAEELKIAAENYIMEKYPQARLSSAPGRTPENSGWGPVWPKSYSRFITAEEIISSQLGSTIDFYAENFWKVSAGGTPAGSIFVREVDSCLSVWWIA